MSTSIFRAKSGNLVIRTEAQTEDEFIREFSSLFGNLASQKALDGIRDQSPNQDGERAPEDPYAVNYKFEDIEAAIDGTAVNGSVTLDLISLLPKYNNIICKLRGYKSDVQETRVIICGDRIEGSDYDVLEVDNKLNYSQSFKHVIAEREAL